MTRRTASTCLSLLASAVLLLSPAYGQAVADPSHPVGNQKDDSQVVTLREFEVSSTTQKDAYIASEAVSGSRLAEKIVNQPFDMQVVTKQFIEDFQLYSGDEQMAFTSGYSRGQNPAYMNGSASSERLHGFVPPVLRDGFSLVGYPPDPAMVEQVEIIKGPQATLYGDGEPGGLINYVMRRPGTTPEYNLYLSGGTYGSFRAQADATGPLYKDKAFYMAVVSNTVSQAPEDYVYWRNLIYDFTVTLKPTSSSALTLNFEKEFTTTARGNSLPKLIVGSKASTTSNPLARTGGVFVGYDTTEYPYFNQYGPMDHIVRNFTGYNALFEQKFGDHWSLRVSGESFYKDFMENRWAAANYDATSQHFTASQPFTERQYVKLGQVQSDLVGKFDTGPIKHALQFGYDTSYQHYEDDGYELPTAQVATLVPLTQQYLDPANPDWTPFNYSLLTRFTTRNLRYIVEQGYFASERMYFWNDKLILMGSVRHNQLFERISDLATGTNGVISTNANTYSVGANYKVLGSDALVLYGNKSTGFDSNVVVDQGVGTVEQPEHSRGAEGGIKSALLNERLDFTLGYFEITKDNVSIANSSYLNPNAGIAQFLGSGVNRVQGFEFDGSAHVSDALTVIGDFSYMQSKLVSAASTPANVGDVIPFTPSYLAGIAARYQFVGTKLNGLSVGVSTNYDGAMLASYATATANRIRLPSVQLWNAFVSYTWKMVGMDHTVGFNVKNIFNRYYLDDLGRPNPGETFSFTYRLKL